MESPHDPSSWLNKHFKVEEDLEQTIIEKKMIRSASKWLQ